MAEVTIYDVYNALGLTAENGTQTLINSIRNETELGGISQVYDGTVAGLENFGIAVNRSTRHQNIFVNELVDRIGIVVINTTDLRNPMKKFKKGAMTQGVSVQEIFSDLIKAQSFNPEDASQTLFKRNPPNTRVLYHNNWRKELYANTIEQTTLQQAFTSPDNLNDFIVSTYNAVYNSNEVDEYIWTKSIMESYVANGFATYVSTPNVTDQTSALEFVKKTRATSTKMQLTQGSRLFNASGVHTRTPKDRLWIMIDADLDATLDVDVLARAFNMNKTNIEERKIVVENFSVNGLQAIMFDENILQIRDKEFRMNSAENPKGLYWNTFLHAHQLFSMGKFQNLVAFMSTGIPPITKLILTPISAYVSIGKKKILDGNIQLDNGVSMEDVTITATISNEDGSPITGATVVPTVKTGGYIEVAVTVNNVSLVDQNLTVTLIATETTPAEGEDPFIRSANTVIVPLPVVEG